MDDIVKAALTKWPNVPNCFGWLGLDARGNWFMRDDQAQAAGPFAGGSTVSKGSLLRHDKLIDFIQRNYEADTSGRAAATTQKWGNTMINLPHNSCKNVFPCPFAEQGHLIHYVILIFIGEREREREIS